MLANGAPVCDNGRERSCPHGVAVSHVEGAAMIVVTEHSTRRQIEQAIAELRARQQRVRVASVREELQAAIDDAIDCWIAATG